MLSKSRSLFFLPISLLLLGGLLGGVRLSKASRFEAYMPVEQREDRLASRLLEGSRAILIRQQVIESLERLLVEQHRFRAIHGRFTHNLQRLEWEVPRDIRMAYEFTVVEATHDRLLVTATSESAGSQPMEVVSIDQESRTHASFPIPVPRAEYLRERARLQLGSGDGDPEVEGELCSRNGVWPEYFEIQKNEKGEWLALGAKPPVAGERIAAADLLSSHPEAGRLQEGLMVESARNRRTPASAVMIAPPSPSSDSRERDESDSPLIIEPLR